MADTKKFLDLSGLNKFWQLVSSKTLGSASLSIDDTKGAVLTYTTADNETTAEAGTIPFATTTNAGLMTAAHVTALNGVNDSIKITNVKVNGTSLTIADKAVNFKLNYNSTDKLIEIVDVNSDNVVSSIDADVFIKDGMVSSGTIVEENNKTYISLSFNTPDGPSEPVKIDVTKLVDIPYINEAIANINTVIEENEEVIAEALTDLDSRITDINIALDEKITASDAEGIAKAQIQTLDSSASILDTTNKKIATAIVETDGKIATENYASLTLDYISDFGVISDAEIANIFA